MQTAGLDRLREIGADLRARTGGAPRTQTAIARSVEVEEEVKAKETVAPEAAKPLFDIKENPINKIMEPKNVGMKQKIEAISKYLITEDENFDLSRKRFAEFEEYLRWAQNERMGLDEKAIQRLIDELKTAENSEITKIVEDITKVQDGADTIRKLLVVARTANLNGTTLAAIAEAMKLQERIKSEMTVLSQRLGEYRKSFDLRQTVYNAQLDKQTGSQKGFFNKVARALTGPNKQIANLVEQAQQNLAAAQENVDHTTHDLSDKQEQMRADLEDGSLTILRTIDATTEKGLTEEIIKNAESSLALIANTRNSIRILLESTAHREAAGHAILEKIAAAKMRETVLKGAMQQVVEATHRQADAINGKLQEHDKKIAAVAAGDPDHAVLSAERIAIDAKHMAALGYEEVLKKNEGTFVKLEADSVQAENQAHQLVGLVEGTKDILNGLFNEALPATTRGLEMGLQQARAMQTAELSASAAAALKRAREITGKNLQELAETQEQMDKAEIDKYNDAIKAIDDAERVTSGRLGSLIDLGLKKQDAAGKLVQSADRLKEVMGEFQEASAIIASRPGEVAAEHTGGRPSRPTGPVANADAPAPG